MFGKKDTKKRKKNSGFGPRYVNKAQEREGKRLTLRSLYYNRYLMIRYLLVLFFFLNMEWAFMTWGTWVFAPAAMLIVMSIRPLFEMFMMLGETDPDVKWTKIFYRIQFIVDAAMAVISLVVPPNEVLPLFANNLVTHIITFAIFAGLAGLAFLCIYRLQKIDMNIDKHYARIKQYEKVTRTHL